jgi:hypothetical protein
MNKTLKGKELNLYKDKLVLTDLQKEVIFGILLGDASMECRLQKPVYAIKVEQTIKKEKYVVHLYNILEPFVGMTPSVRVIKASSSPCVNFKELRSL